MKTRLVISAAALCAGLLVGGCGGPSTTSTLTPAPAWQGRSLVARPSFDASTRDLDVRRDVSQGMGERDERLVTVTTVERRVDAEHVSNGRIHRRSFERSRTTRRTTTTRRAR